MRFTLRRILLLVLALILGVALWVGWQAYGVYEGLHAITGKVAPRATGEPTVVIPPLNGDKRFNILVLGSDTDRKVEEAHPLSQSMIVVTVDPVHDKVTLLSIPRDYWVPITGHGYAKIDLAFKYGGQKTGLDGGVTLARLTVEKLFHIPIHYYAWVGLSGFKKVVDTFGGVDLNITHPILDDFYPDDLRPGDPYAFTRIFIPPGWRHVSGRQALEYVRSRHGDLIGDFGRSQRQQQVLLALRGKIDVQTLLTSLPALVSDLQGYVRTDLNLEQLYQVADLSRHINLAAVQKVVLSCPRYCTPGVTAGQDVLFPHWSAIRPEIRSLFAPIPATVPHALPRVKPSGSRTTTPAHPRPTFVIKGPQFPAFTHLPGNLIYEQQGNIFELSQTGQVKQVTNLNAIAMPAVSPDRRRIVFMRFSRYADDLYVLNRRTGSIAQLTNNQNFADVHNNLWAAWPTWSSTGGKLLFSSDRAKLSFPESEARAVDLAIWEEPSSGGTPVQLTIPAVGAGGDTDPSWRPGYNQFIYLHWQYNQATNLPYSQIIVRDALDTRSWTLTPPDQNLVQPAIDSTGHRLVYIKSSATSSQVVDAPIIGGATNLHLGAAVALASGKVAQPAFSPDGRWVSYLQASGNGFALYVVSVKGGTPVQITQAGSNLDALSRPVWTR